MADHSKVPAVAEGVVEEAVHLWSGEAVVETFVEFVASVEPSLGC